MKFCDTTFSTEDMVLMLTKMMLLIQAETAGYFSFLPISTTVCNNAIRHSVFRILISFFPLLS